MVVNELKEIGVSNLARVIDIIWSSIALGCAMIDPIASNDKEPSWFVTALKDGDDLLLTRRYNVDILEKILSSRFRIETTNFDLDYNERIARLIKLLS